MLTIKVNKKFVGCLDSPDGTVQRQPAEYFRRIEFLKQKFMKNVVIFLSLLGLFILAANTWIADDTETKIQFTNASWNDILKKAKSENKIIFLDIYASWCGPCKLLKRTTFSDEEVGSFFNSNFINATFDGEKEEGQKLAEEYDIHSYPTMFFINPDGSVKKTVVGYHNAIQLLRAAKGALK
jgi:thiol:disulfide interchange protein